MLAGPVPVADRKRQRTLRRRDGPNTREGLRAFHTFQQDVTLAHEAPSVSRQEDRHAVACPLGHLRRRYTEPAGIPPPSPGKRMSPGPRLYVYDLAQQTDQSRMDGHRPGLARRAALQLPLLMNIAGVRPLLADLRLRPVDQELTPAAVGQGRIAHMQRHRLLLTNARVVQGSEEGCIQRAPAGTLTDPREQLRHLPGIQQGPLVDRLRDLGRCSLLPALGQGVGFEDAMPTRTWSEARSPLKRVHRFGGRP